MRVLVLNPGSSSLKAVLLDPTSRDPLASSSIDLGADATTAPALQTAVEEAIAAVSGRMADAVGYRVVHGGTELPGLTLLDDASVATIEALADLAPLHNRVAAATIRAGRTALPNVPHVAAFDTAFHETMPAEAKRYPVPESWLTDWGIRRYGFHGLSVAWSVRRASELLERPAGDLRLIVAHLGSGCSVTAVDGGNSVDTSMGMTPLEGLMMGTRAGSIDPGIMLRLLRQGHLDLDELEATLDHGSGLKGVSGRTSDVRQLLAAEAAGDEPSRIALALFVRRAAQGIGAAATSLGGLDGIVFTGGIGEHSTEIRARIVERLGVLGIPPIAAIDPGVDSVLAEGPPAVLRVAAREDVMIAIAVAGILSPP